MKKYIKGLGVYAALLLIIFAVYSVLPSGEDGGADTDDISAVLCNAGCSNGGIIRPVQVE